MASDFIGVPFDEWRQLHDRTSTCGWVVMLLAAFIGLLWLALIRKGVLAGFGDLFPQTVTGG